MYSYQIQMKQYPDSFHDLSILDIFSDDDEQNPYACNKRFIQKKEERAKFMEANNNLVVLLKYVDRECKPFQPPGNSQPYSEKIDKYCNIKIKELKDSIVRGKKFD